MTKYSLRARMMILTLTPTLIIGLMISTFFIVHRYNELQRQLVDAGINIIEPLAVLSEHNITKQNQVLLHQIISQLHRRHSDFVRAIMVFDENNQLVVTSNHRFHPVLPRVPDGEPLPDSITVENYRNVMILRIPILPEKHTANESTTRMKKLADTPLGYVAIEMDLQSLRLQQYTEVFISALLLLFCLGIAILFSYSLMCNVTGPIRNMVSTVDRIRRGQLDSRVEGHMLGELHMLKNGINAMAMSLTAYHEEMHQNIEQATSDLRETLEQMGIQNVQLDLAKKRAQEAVRIKSEFLANISHELRTPLNGVIGFTRQTLKTPLNANQRDYLHTIECSANNLLSIINDVLDFSKLEAGKLILEIIPFPLRATFDETVILLAPTAHEKGIELTLNIQRDVPDNVIGDPLRLQQIVTNLLGNAIKFTEHGNIDIRVEKRSEGNNKIELELQVRDTGIGIPVKQQSQLFQAFRQADASISRRHGGTGLGLVITQKLVKEMGGDIFFHSRINRGSTFWCKINLELNPNAANDPRALDCLKDKHLGYIEANPAAAQATLDMLITTPAKVSHSSFISQLPEEHYDILIVGVPVTQSLDQIIHDNELTLLLNRADYLIMALPCQMQVSAEALKARGVDDCITKPLAITRLIPVIQDRLTSKMYYDTPERTRLPLTIMAVDDNPANLKLIGALLEEQVDNIILCESGKQSIEQARKQTLDIILMDIQMPEIDGIRASAIIRTLPHHANTPIVAVTAHVIEGDRERLLKAGMNDYLAKPIDEIRLSQLLARYSPGIQPKDFLSPALLPSFDWSLALRQATNKKDLAFDLLQMLVDFFPEVRKKVTYHLDNNHTTDLYELIHKLHGSASYSGVPRLKQLCQQLENHLHLKVTLADIRPELLELLDEMDNITKMAKAVL